jgi:D-3-phosphoglycerate dehydrogenase / 2-oxoglutarate reductase
MFKVLVSDKFSERGLEVFAASGTVQADYKAGLSPDELIAAIPEYDGLVVRSKSRVTPEVVAVADKLKVVGRAGVGVDNIDQNAATKAGICVMNTPGGNNRTTAEHTIAMLLSLSRNIPKADASLRGGKWEKPKFIGTEVLNKTIGVIGLGNIGSVVGRLARGLDMKVLGHDPFCSDERAKQLGIKKVELDELFANSDYVTVHVPKNDKTTGLINKAAIDTMKDGVFVLNCARGGIVDEADLLAALESGKVRGAALDVFTVEPPEGNPLAAHPNVVITPHLGASTTEAQDNVAIMVAEQIVDYLNTGTILNSVNVPSLPPEQMGELAPYLSVARGMGSMLAQLSDKAPEEIHLLYAGNAAGLRTELIRASAIHGFMETIAEVDVNSINAQALAQERGIGIQETHRNSVKGFATLVGVKAVYPGGEELDLQGLPRGEDDPRLVKFNGLSTDIELSGNLVVIRNTDKPGVVGEVGTELGKAGINIANLRLARRDAGGEAVLMVSVDEPAGKDVLATLQSLSNVTGAKSVRL